MDAMLSQSSFYLTPMVAQQKRDPVFDRHRRGGVGPGAGVKSTAPTKPKSEPRPGLPRAF